MSTEDRKKLFLDALGVNSGSVAAACREVGISRQAYYKWRKADADFAENCDRIISFYKEAHEAEKAREREERKTAALSGANEAALDVDPESMIARYKGRPATEIRAEAESQLTEALRCAGHYSDSLLPLIRAAATQCALMTMAFSEIDRYAFTQIEFSATGAVKLGCNPAYERVAKLSESYARALARLGLVHDRKNDNVQDGMTDFLQRMNMEEGDD